MMADVMTDQTAIVLQWRYPAPPERVSPSQNRPG